MNYWVFPYNPKIFDVIRAFKTLGVIDWGTNNNVFVDDIVFIYRGGEDGGLILSSRVIKDHVACDESIDDTNFFVGKIIDNNFSNIVRLKLIEIFDSKKTALLNRYNLNRNGLTFNIRSKITLNRSPQLLEYIMEVLNVLPKEENIEKIQQNISFNHNSNKNSMPIIRSASKIRQGNLVLYATYLKVSDLMIPNFYSIERLDPENANERGYQRLLNKGRAKKLADYIVDGQDADDAFLPTSIFIATDKNIEFNQTNNTIEIDIDEVGPFNIVDGQHRVEGLKMAAEKDPRVLEFEIPVNIGVQLSYTEQMCHFLIVNTTQKSVEEGVSQRIRARLSKLIGVDEIPNLPRWILNSVEKGEDEKALQYVDFLNNEDSSPWKNKIKMAGDDSGEGSVNQRSFVKAIKKYILVPSNPVFTTENEERQHRIFLNYWKAIANIIGYEEPTVLYKYIGLELFCRFCVPFFSKMVNMPDYKVQTMQDLLEHVFENATGDALGVGHTDFWVRGGPASGKNAAAFSKINTEMVKALHISQDTNFDNEMEI